MCINIGFRKSVENVWIFAEQHQGIIDNVTLELLGKGREIADKLGTDLIAILTGDNIKNLTQNLIMYGADRVIYIKHPKLKIYLEESFTSAIAQVCLKEKPGIFLIGATDIGRDLAPRLAARMNAGLTADCTQLNIDVDNGLLVQTRPAYGGEVMATIITPETRPQMATVRRGVMKKNYGKYNASGTIDIFIPDLDYKSSNTSIMNYQYERNTASDMTTQRCIVAGGSGLGGTEGFDILRSLAEAIGGIVGASRMAVERGWIDQIYQIGQTGQSVAPDIYIACGISGSVQHMEGIKNAKNIIAINSNPNAPIFDMADYGIVGDVFDVIPKLTQSLKLVRRK
ncbi:MAG: electron transfer flavoprotein subunit alpha/FixB family protein [Clostridia bacterium]|nr:electron transfer flavoprotein subunit alpha/FixB family protein [Clostridia bacterium]